MKKFNSYLPYILAVLFIGIILFAFSRGNKPNNTDEQKNNVKTTEAQIIKPAEKIQVFLFHPTARCISCINIGKYAKETIEQKFPEELKSGRIEFKEINIDLPENKELATEFKAAGSSLFINPIIDGKDNIKEDTQVWKLVSNKQAFISYLTDKIKIML